MDDPESEPPLRETDEPAEVLPVVPFGSSMVPPLAVLPMPALLPP